MGKNLMPPGLERYIPGMQQQAAPTPDGSAGLEIGFDLKAVLGRVSDTLDRVHAWATANTRQSPLVRKLAASAVSDGSVYFYVSLGGPTGGRIWDVRRAAQWPGGATDPFTALGSVTVALAVMSNNQVPNKGTATCAPMLDLALAPQQCPNDASFNVHTLTVRFNEALVMIFKGTANTQALMCSGQVEEYIESSAEAVVM